jgi:host factor-I protein
MLITQCGTVRDTTHLQDSRNPGFATIGCMVISNAARRRQKSPPPGDTGQETLYLRFLSEKHVPVAVKMRDGEIVNGWIEYFDDRMIRLTREGKPNLFIYKHQIRTITEQAGRTRARQARKAADEGEVAASGESK